MLTGTTALLGLSTAGQIGSTVAGAVGQANALRTQGGYQQMVSDTNARLAKLQGDDAITRGDRNAALIKQQGKQMIGSQRASLAAQGIDVNSDSAADVQESTAAMAAKDSLQVKNNAWREAWGYQVQANQSSAAGEFAKIGSDSAANQTLLTGGMNAVAAGAKGGYDITKNWISKG